MFLRLGARTASAPPTSTARSGTPRGRRGSDLGTVAVFHFGGFPNFMPRSPFSVIPLDAVLDPIFAAELLWSPIMQRFPKIKMALAEGGIGWVPYFLEKADFVYDHHRAWTGADFGDKLPARCSASTSRRVSSTTRPACATVTRSASR